LVPIKRKDRLMPIKWREINSHKIIGYVLLVLGLVFVVIPPVFGISVIVSGGSAVPKILETPVLSGNSSASNSTFISTSNLNSIIAAVFPAVNLVLLFVLSLILIYAGGLIMSRGVSLIKEIKLTAVRGAVKEVSEEVDVRKEKPSEPGTQ
jgi:hypothetical protein